MKSYWNELKEELKQKYAEITDDDLRFIEGKEDQITAKLQKVLGKNKDEIIHMLKKMS